MILHFFAILEIFIKIKERILNTTSNVITEHTQSSNKMDGVIHA